MTAKSEKKNSEIFKSKIKQTNGKEKQKKQNKNQNKIKEKQRT